MKAAVIVFPGSNCDRDLAVALRRAGFDVAMVWHKDTVLPPGLDVLAVPGGFSFGDYLRCGAIAARAPIMAAVVAFAEGGGVVLGICNGFQILTECGLLPGAIMRNAGLRFVCRPVTLAVETADSPFTRAYGAGQSIELPVAHHDGCYVADAETLSAIEAEGRVAFRYAEPVNGSMQQIAGLLSAKRRVLGMMPHPERAADPVLGNADGAPLFDGLIPAMA